MWYSEGRLELGNEKKDPDALITRLLDPARFCSQRSALESQYVRESFRRPIHSRLAHAPQCHRDCVANDES